MTLEEMKQIKKERGYTLAQLAEYANVPLGTLQKIFSGATEAPRYATKKAIEKALSRPDDDYTGTEYDTSVLRESSAYQVETLEKKQGEYTLEDYYSLPDERRVELIDGVIYDMSSPLFVHQQIAGYVYAQLTYQITAKGGKGLPMIAPVDVNLDRDDKTMVQPDVLIICNRDMIRRWGVYGAPEFLLEVVSVSSKSKDYVKKLSKYQQAGVQEYWIIDPDKRRVTVYDFKTEDGCPEIYPLTGILGLKMYQDEIQIDLDMVNSMIQDWSEDGKDK